MRQWNEPTFPADRKVCDGNVLTSSFSLAYAELSFVVAAIFHRGGPTLSLFKTDESDVIETHDFLLPLPRLDSKGVRVMVH